MVVVLALAFLLSATITIYILFRGGDTRVPNVIGKQGLEAQRIAEKAGLRVKIQRRSDTSAPAETVIETRPAANSSVKKDSSLTIVVSSGPPEPRGHLRPDHRSKSGTDPRPDFSAVAVFETPSITAARSDRAGLQRPVLRAFGAT